VRVVRFRTGLSGPAIASVGALTAGESHCVPRRGAKVVALGEAGIGEQRSETSCRLFAGPLRSGSVDILSLVATRETLGLGHTGSDGPADVEDIHMKCVRA
jgi:hypothetical protein